MKPLKPDGPTMLQSVYIEFCPLLQMREMRHDNLCGFIGATIEPVTSIVSEYCQRGSLQDRLYDENFALDEIVLASLVADLVKVSHQSG